MEGWPTAPDRIGRYRVRREIAAGGFATVYEAVDDRLESVVAVKVLSGVHSRDPDIVRRFIDEARLMRQLRVPGLLTVYDSGEHDGRPYFVMEYCGRGTLGDRLRSLDRPLTPNEGLGLVRAVAAAVRGAHRSDPPVVHRDLKPSNFLIRHTPDGTGSLVGDLLAADESLVLADFGLAKIVTPEATQLSLIAYTRGFAAPEQVRGDPTITPRADVYSASAVVVAAVTGAQPEQVFIPGQQVFTEQVLQSTGALRAALERGLQYDPKRRPADIMEWADALDPGQRGPALRPAGPNRRLLLTGAAAVVLGGGGVWLWRRDVGPPVLGPDQAQAGDEVAFAVVGGAGVEWHVENRTATGTVLTVRPRTPGTVTIQARTAAGTRRVALAVRDRDSSGLKIVGPAHLPLGVVTSLDVEGAAGQSLTWQVAGRASSETALSLRPTTAGLLVVRVTARDGRTTERTFTAAPA